jgi:hypothetical protein
VGQEADWEVGMRRIRTVGLGLATVFAMGAFAASASAAPPELGRCEEAPAGTGKFKDKGCVKHEVPKGGFEWLPGPGVGNEEFSSRAGSSTIETKRKIKITCKFATGFGRYTGPKEDAEVIELRECTGFGGFPCNSVGAPPQQINSTALTSTLGFVKAPKSVGVDLASSSAAPIAAIECHVANIVFKMSVTGSVIGTIKQVGKMSSTFTEQFKAKKGKQKVERLEGGPKDTLTCVFEKGSEPCGFSSTDTLKNIEPLEINPVL